MFLTPVFATHPRPPRGVYAFLPAHLLGLLLPCHQSELLTFPISYPIPYSLSPTTPCSAYPLSFQILPYSSAQRASRICFPFIHLRTHFIATGVYRGMLSPNPLPTASLRPCRDSHTTSHLLPSFHPSLLPPIL